MFSNEPVYLASLRSSCLRFFGGGGGKKSLPIGILTKTDYDSNEIICGLLNL
jgi:hypothetical protein